MPSVFPPPLHFFSLRHRSSRRQRDSTATSTPFRITALYNRMVGSPPAIELKELKRRIKYLHKALNRPTVLEVMKDFESSAGSEPTLSEGNTTETQTKPDIEILGQRIGELLKDRADTELSKNYISRSLDNLWFRYCALVEENECLKERLSELGYNPDGTKINKGR